MTEKNKSPIDQDVSTDSAQLRRKSVRGGTITLASQALGLAIHLISTVTLARILTPEEYGIIAMVAAFTAFAGLFRDLGLSSSTIQRDNLTHGQLSTIFWINAAAGAVLTLLVAFLAPWVARFYARPELTAVTMAMSLNFMIAGLSTQQSALLVRRMLFGKRAVATLAGALVSLAISITMALRGFGYWALVYGNIGGALVTSVLLNVLSGWMPGLPRFDAGVRSMLKYGANVTGFDVVNYFHRNLDNLLIGRFWGADALGLYSRAYQLMMYPITHLRGPMNAVAFPVMSRLQNEPERFRAYYCRITQLLAFISMPAMAWLLVVADPLIELALGPKWLEVSPIFSILALVAFIQPVASLRGMVLLSLGRGPRYLRWGLINATVVSTGFLIGVYWGPLGVAVAYAIVVYAILYPSLVYIFRGTPVSPSDFFTAVARPAVASLLAVATTGALDVLFFSGTSVAIRLAALFTIFVFVYLLVFALTPRGRVELLSLIRLFKEMAGRK